MGNINMIPVQSSQLAEIGHDPDTNTLAIRFHGKGRPGNLYHYQNVTADDFEALKSAESHGSHFIRNIKPHADKFPYQRIDEAKEDK